MRYKVVRRLYCPFRGRRVYPGEVIEIEKKHLPGYLPYIEQPKETAKPKPVYETAQDKPKKGKSGDK